MFSTKRKARTSPDKPGTSRDKLGNQPHTRQTRPAVAGRVQERYFDAVTMSMSPVPLAAAAASFPVSEVWAVMALPAGLE